MIIIEENNIIYCLKCGKENSKEGKFCINCGNQLNITEDRIKSTAESFKDSIKNNDTYKRLTENNYDERCKSDFDNKDMVNFIQKKVEYYIPKLKEIQELYKTTSWNWAAFFLNSWWFLYRKMYAVGFGIILTEVVVGSIIPSLSLLVNIAIAIISGLYGNMVYLKHIQKQLESFDNMEEDIKQRLILNKGGVNIVIPIILAIITFGFLLLIGTLVAYLSVFSSTYY